MNSSAPHLSSLTVGEWSPEGLGGRLPPVRETDRLKPRQPREGLLAAVAAPRSRGAKGNHSAASSGSPREAGQAAGPKARREKRLLRGQERGLQLRVGQVSLTCPAGLT